MDFLFLPLCHDKLDAETHDVGNEDFGQGKQETVAEEFPEACVSQFVGCKIVLIAEVVHAEEQCRHQGNDYHRHNALGVDGIVYAHARARSGVRHEEESLHTVEHGTEGTQLAAFFKIGANVV